MPVPGALAIVYGGPSAEHEVSCISARRIARAALEAGSTVTLVGLSHDKRWVDARGVLSGIERHDALPSPDDLLHGAHAPEAAHLDALVPRDAVVFPVLHGPFGEDGVIQGHLEALNLPYVGAGVLSSAVCMDKGVCKSLLRDAGIPVAAWHVASRWTWGPDVMDEVLSSLGLPVFVKPANLGSSIGVTKVTDLAALGDAVIEAFQFDDHVVLEEHIEGRELEVAVMGNEDVRVSQAGEIIASREFYDFDDKYVLGAAEIVAPTDLSATQLSEVQRLAEAAYRTLRVEGLGRVDLFLRADDRVVVNEVNTMPGFTPISMFPMLWEAEGVPFARVVEELIVLAEARHARRHMLRTHRVVEED